MKTEKETYYPFSFLTGKKVQAQYADPMVPMYRGYPLIEALGSILSSDEARKRLANYPEYSNKERELPAEVRIHCVDAITQFIQPLSNHLHLEQTISRMIRTGYVGRNPIEKGFWGDLDRRVEKMDSDHRPVFRGHSNVSGVSLSGISGGGKTTAVNNILSQYPQVHFHSKYHGNPFSYTQVVWLQLECPGDASVKGLCLSFFLGMDNVLGTNYYKYYANGGRTTVDTLIPAMGRLAGVHGLGILVIDEAQNLAEARNGGEKRLLNHLVELENNIGVPVLLVGTYKLLPILGGNEFRQARRMTGEGNLRWDPMKNDREWELFVRSLWRYQYTKNRTDYSQRYSNNLFDISQGIIDVAVKVFRLAQNRAIQSSYEKLDEKILRSVAHDSLGLLEKPLAAIRNGDVGALEKFEDIYPGWKEYFANQERNSRYITNADDGKDTQEIETAAECQSIVFGTHQPSQSKEILDGEEPAVKGETKKSIQDDPNSLMEIVKSGSSNNCSGYESLKKMKLIHL